MVLERQGDLNEIRGLMYELRKTICPGLSVVLRVAGLKQPRALFAVSYRRALPSVRLSAQPGRRNGRRLRSRNATELPCQHAP